MHCPSGMDRGKTSSPVLATAMTPKPILQITHGERRELDDGNIVNIKLRARRGFGIAFGILSVRFHRIAIGNALEAGKFLSGWDGGIALVHFSGTGRISRHFT